MIAIIDYGIGNVSSIGNMLKKIQQDAIITSDLHTILKADKLILPGIGAFDKCMQRFNQSGLREIIETKVISEKVPVLGICVGVQMLLENSEEGVLPGLGWIKGKSIAFDKSKLTRYQKIPNMGWADVDNYSQSKLFLGMPEDPRFYFVHAYHLLLNDPADCLVTSKYGYQFAAGIEQGNIMGVQFHPEKSHKFGMKLLENFYKNY